MEKYGSGIPVEVMEREAMHGGEGEPGVMDILKLHQLTKKDAAFLDDLANRYKIYGKDRRKLLNLMRRLAIDKEEHDRIVNVLREAFSQLRTVSRLAKSFEDVVLDVCGEKAFMVLRRGSVALRRGTAYDTEAIQDDLVVAFASYLETAPDADTEGRTY